MRTHLLSGVLLLVLPSLALAQGVLAPPTDAFAGGVPISTMKSLGQIEARTPLTQPAGSTTGLSISAPGSYYITGNIAVASGDAITIATDNVTLDLNGFTISSSASPATGSAVLINGAYSAIAIRNGHIRGTTTYTSPTFTFGGFNNGISYSLGGGRDHSAERISVTGVATNGILLGWEGSTITDCTATICGAQGLKANAVHNSSAVTCGNSAITAIAVSNCYGNSVAFSGGHPGISAKTATGCKGTSNSGPGIDAVAVTGCSGESVDGCGINTSATAADSFGTSTNLTGLSAATATNCYGYSYNGWGLYAQEATNCHGKSTNGTRGLHAENTATGCTGEIISANGPTGTVYTNAEIPRGLYALTAENCVGAIGTHNSADGTSTGTANGLCYGLRADTATNCHGDIWASGTPNTNPGLDNAGLSASAATNCFGSSTNGYGIKSTMAMNCSGTSTSGTGLSAVKGATNCVGTTTTGPEGLYAGNSATNCQGTNTSGTDPAACGLHVSGAATGCYGSSGYGLAGLNAAIAQNCKGTSTNGKFGLLAYESATNCSGYIGSASNPAPGSAALRAAIATSCYAENYSTRANTYGILATVSAHNSTGAGVIGIKAEKSANYCDGTSTDTTSPIAISTGTANFCTTGAGTISATTKNFTP